MDGLKATLERCVLRFFLWNSQHAESIERMENGALRRRTPDLQVMKVCARYCHGPRLSRPESSSAVCNCGRRDELHQVRWSRFMQTAMNHHAQLVVDALLDGQPVTLAKQWCDVVSSWCVRDQSCGDTDKDGLQGVEVAGWQSCEHDVAVVQATVYEACDECV